jgi:hypothetical protein
MAKRSRVITLQAFIRKYLDKKSIDKDEFQRYYVIAADGLKELYLHHFPDTITTTLTIDSTNLTSDFPADFLDYVYIAVEKNGRWWTFTRDDSMSDRTITGITGSDLSLNTYMYGPGAVGGLNDFWFKPDYENSRFLFSGVDTASDVVVLNYITNGIDVITDSSTAGVTFPIYAEDVMEKYIRWQICELDDGPASECNRREKQYEKSLAIMRNIHNSSVREIKDAWLGSSNQTFIRTST